MRALSANDKRRIVPIRCDLIRNCVLGAALYVATLSLDNVGSLSVPELSASPTWFAAGGPGCPL